MHARPSFRQVAQIPPSSLPTTNPGSGRAPNKHRKFIDRSSPSSGRGSNKPSQLGKTLALSQGGQRTNGLFKGERPGPGSGRGCRQTITVSGGRTWPSVRAGQEAKAGWELLVLEGCRWVACGRGKGGACHPIGRWQGGHRPTHSTALRPRALGAARQAATGSVGLQPETRWPWVLTAPLTPGPLPFSPSSSTWVGRESKRVSSHLGSPVQSSTACRSAELSGAPGAGSVGRLGQASGSGFVDVLGGVSGLGRRGRSTGSGWLFGLSAPSVKIGRAGPQPPRQGASR